MSRRRSATGWSAGATVLTFTGSLAGSAAGAMAVAAGGMAVAASLAAGTVTVSAGFVSADLASALGSAAFAAASGSFGFATALAASGTVAVVSILKSPTVGGGTLAGSGRGTAASMASSAALARGVVDWAASAEVADTVRKVAATAISTRSNPARFIEQSRIITPPWANCPGMEQSLGIIRHGLRGKRRLDPFLSRTPARHGSNADDTYAPIMQPAPCGTTHDKLTSNYPLAFGSHV